MKKVDIVVPLFNEEEGIVAFLSALIAEISSISYHFHVYFINDGSTDSTEILLKNFIEKNSKIENIDYSIMNFSRNFGHQSALIAGMIESKGDCVITMDGDLQHPPQLLRNMLEHWEENFDVVQTIRTTTRGVGIFKLISSRFFYFFINKFTDLQVSRGSSDFRLISKKANLEIIKLFQKWSSRDFLLRIVIPNFNFNTKFIEFVAPQRFAGESHYSLKKMSKLFLAASISYTKFPLLLLYTINIFFFFFLFVVFYTVLIAQFGTLINIIMTIILLLQTIIFVILNLIFVFCYKIYREISYQPVFIIRDNSAIN